jgi:tricorn protease
MHPLRFRISLLGLVLMFASAAALFAVDVRDTRMLAQPAISPDHIAFYYANDLWVADLDGRNVRRLTSDLGVEANPVFSPDGSLIAFTAQYDGNTDVYIVPTRGGVPKRLTWHPSPDIVQGFTPDGKAVLFVSGRASYTPALQQLYTVSIDGGYPEPLKIPNAARASLSPDGSKIAYNPLPDAFTQWKNYRGGRNSVIWIVRLADLSLEKIPQPAGRCNDPNPMWIGDLIYFRSDRNGEFNLFSFDPRTKKIEQLTDHRDFPVLNASAGAGRIIYEQAGRLHILDPKTKAAQSLTIGIAADLAELRERYARGARWIRSSAVSPSGLRAAFDFRGEIVTVPAEKGDPRNLTQTPAVHERFPAWSPDGKSIAYFSDASGENELHVRPQDGKGETRRFKLDGAGFYDSPVWSPDSGKICYADNSYSLYWIDLKSGAIKKIASEKLYTPAGLKSISGAWSPDSRWIAYTVSTTTYFQRIYVYSLARDLSTPITDGLSDAVEPVFDALGKYLYFFASTDAGPVRQWFDQSNADMRRTSTLYVAALTKDAPNPLVRESDEEKTAPEKPADKPVPAPAKTRVAVPETKVQDTVSPAKDAAPAVAIDFDGLDHRIVPVPIPAGSYRGLEAGDAGQVFYLENPPDIGSAAGPGATLHKYDFKARKDDVLLTGVTGFMLTADKKKIGYNGPGGAYFITALQPKPQPGQGRLNLEAIDVRVVPTAEWREIFDEAWRVNRDYFYATNMHGADWPAMKKKYEPFLDHLACRSDLNRLIQWMCSELGVGHHRVGGGDFPTEPRIVPGGLLGADYAVENGRYRFKKVLGGLNWNPNLRSPLTEPGVDVKAGEYLLAVNGRDLKAPANLFAQFENTAGKIVELTVGPNPDGSGSRTVQAVPVASETALRNRDWIEGNLKKVDKATNGRVAYVYVPDTSISGWISFKRYFYPQADRDAIIVDERFNGGGSLADYYIDHLRQPVSAYWNMRYGDDLKTPSASIQGPKVMITDETAGSGGDFLPFMWRKFKMGPLVGKRTWGGLVGVLGFPELMDGGVVTAPNVAIWTEDGWVVENEGIPPDVEVEQTPADVMAGHDPQLEKAIQIALDELAKNPPRKIKRPDYPVRVRK